MRSFVEVETPVRIQSPAPEEYIDCPECAGKFLRASPELQMKKLLAMGMERIYQIGPCFREGEFGSCHNTEFTMLEWYRLNATYDDIAGDVKSLISFLSGKAMSFTEISVREAYDKFASWDPWNAWDKDRFDFDMASKIEPELKKIGGCVFLRDYPVQASSLSLVRLDHAERWELYMNGIEIANCFTELCDSNEQRRRFEFSRELRKKIGEASYPLDEEFLSIVGSIESAAGVALGIDRLVMVLLGRNSIHEVRAAE
jgi:lysyl-tRNA synthetase class 2